jgi:hypothetical protein
MVFSRGGSTLPTSWHTERSAIRAITEGPTVLVAVRQSNAKNLVVAGEIFFVRSYIGISQDPITSTHQKKDDFWMRVQDAWNNKRPRTIAE